MNWHLAAALAREHQRDLEHTARCCRPHPARQRGREATLAGRLAARLAPAPRVACCA